MARLPRLAIPGLPHHVTQRGNGRGQVFFSDEDCAAYVAGLAGAARRWRVEVIAWCLMPTHVHLILQPADEGGISRMMAEVSRDHARRIHQRLQRTGHFWQDRFGCVAMDEAHLGAALSYVLMNPVRAGLVEWAVDWPWSNAISLCGGPPDALSPVEAILQRRPDLPALLNGGADTAETLELHDRLRLGETIGRPAGSAEFLRQLEEATGRRLAPQRRGPKPTKVKEAPSKRGRKNKPAD